MKASASTFRFGSFEPGRGLLCDDEAYKIKMRNRTNPLVPYFSAMSLARTIGFTFVLCAIFVGRTSAQNSYLDDQKALIHAAAVEKRAQSNLRPQTAFQTPSASSKCCTVRINPYHVGAYTAESAVLYLHSSFPCRNEFTQESEVQNHTPYGNSSGPCPLPIRPHPAEQ